MGLNTKNAELRREANAKKEQKRRRKNNLQSQITRMQGATELVLPTQLTKESKYPPPKDQICAKRRGRVHLPPV
jgi:hypothetical protein